MNIRFDEQKLSDIMKDFYNATGINITILDDSGSIVLKSHEFFNDYCSCIQQEHKRDICLKSDLYLIEKCRKSKKMESHICRAGLTDYAIPIMYNNTIVCFIVFGQMKRDDDFSAVEKYIRNLNLDINLMRHHYDRLPKYSDHQIQSIANIAAMLSRYILFEDMLKPTVNETLERALDYINENLETKLCITDICRKTNISKSVLYKNFHSQFNCTVNEYIASERIRKSVALLVNTDLSIENIAITVGFSSTAYYGKMFKKINGTTPLKYRIENKMY